MADAAQAPQPGTPAHDAAMAAKADATAAAAAAAAQPTPLGGAPAAQPNVAQRPEHVPEKFWDPVKGEARWDDLAKSYVELEKAKGQPATPDPAQAAAQAPVGADGKPNMAALSAEFAEKGTLSEASYTALAAVGVDKGMVDAYIEGQKALAASRDEQGYSLAGGKEAFAAMSQWAATALPAAEVATINASLAGTPAQMAMAVAALKARYEAANGREPTLTSGNGNADTAGDKPFASKGEMTAAMRDPRYKSDAAYRADVERRTAAMPD